MTILKTLYVKCGWRPEADVALPVVKDFVQAVKHVPSGGGQ